MVTVAACEGQVREARSKTAATTQRILLERECWCEQEALFDKGIIFTMAGFQRELAERRIFDNKDLPILDRSPVAGDEGGPMPHHQDRSHASKGSAREEFLKRYAETQARTYADAKGFFDF